MYTLLLFLRYYAPFMVWDKADQGTFNAVSGFATASSLNVAVMGHDTARGCGTLYKTVCVCVGNGGCQCQCCKRAEYLCSQVAANRVMRFGLSASLECDFLD